MPETRLHITIPEAVWIGRLSRSYPETRFRILAAIPDESTGVGLTEIHSEQIDQLLDEMREYDAVETIEILSKHERQALVQFETTHPMLLTAARDSGVPLEMPFELSDGTVTWELTAPSDRLSELGDELRSLGLSFTIDYIQQDVDNEQLLTDSQLALLETAIESGYYDTPRSCSLTELATTVDRAKSTVSETLHRAEGKIIKQYAGGDGTVDRGDTTTAR